MRDSIRDFVRLAAETFPCHEPIYEFGAYQVAGQEQLANLRPLFPGKTYVGCDMRPGPGVDRVVELSRIDLPDGVAATVLCLDTIEHVEFVRESVQEMYRVLMPGGMLVLSSVMQFKIHDYPYDYWRFTPEAFRSLLRCFEHSVVDCAGDPEFPHTVVAVAFKSAPPDPERLAAFNRQLVRWKEAWSPPPKPRWTRFVIPFLPPILLDLYRLARYGRR